MLRRPRLGRSARRWCATLHFWRDTAPSLPLSPGIGLRLSPYSARLMWALPRLGSAWPPLPPQIEIMTNEVSKVQLRDVVGTFVLGRDKGLAEEPGGAVNPRVAPEVCWDWVRSTGGCWQAVERCLVLTFLRAGLS